MSWVAVAVGTGVAAASGAFSSAGGSESFSTTSATQQELEKTISEWLTPLIGKKAPTYPGQLTADMPQLLSDAFSDYASAFGGDLGELSQATIKNLISGEPAYTFDPAATTRRWEETYANPVMAAWRENVLPGIKEGFNLPGVLYSRDRGRGVAKEASKFYGQYVAPSLYSSLQTGEAMEFQSAEAAAGRRVGALSLPYQQTSQAMGLSLLQQQAEQVPLTALYQEYLRTIAEPGFAATLGTGLATSQTVENVVYQGDSGNTGPLMAALMMASAGAGGTGSPSYGPDAFGQWNLG